MAWVKVAEAGAVGEGKGLGVLVRGRDLALFNVGGTVYCIDNSCPHRDAPLADGWLSGETVTCPWHAWQINVRTGAVFPFDEMCAVTHPCRIEPDGIYVELD